ncbi:MULTISPECIES: hypothetical protein [Enterobacteriaceae]|uniref:Uncharacterized protein n=1 Tax=Citrobacter telavivensis TaxID=2653932 RepID=A0A6L5EFD0_9ENTR|nr:MULTISPECIES: hypothetical protein [Enterobacteriaceae]EJR7831335.1 hypothetical protein [Salmonella enterica subsp. enterica serovar Orion]CAI9394941.1 hypothetical protein CITSP_04720 [Citrobacter sp. T1.2D-1]HAK7475057.1 hypothetical protein [Salmonella enterica]HDR2614805.1 hypothetical protein [Enterobacter ludwigii]KLV70759.1 hypothetical protein SK37_05009 [Citrobacter sp. MGH109]
MMPLDKYDDYRALCYEALQSDMPDAIQDIYALMLKCRSEYMLNFQQQFQGWVLNKYLMPAIQSPNKLDIFLAWESRNADWKHILRMSLLGGRVGSVARTLRMSLLTFAEQHSKADR